MLAYICRGGGSIGWGHVSRGQALLSAAGAGDLLLLGNSDEVREELYGRASILPFDPSRLDRYGLIVVDDYPLSQADIDGFRSHAPVAVVDDWVRLDARCDVLVNPNVGADAN